MDKPSDPSSAREAEAFAAQSGNYLLSHSVGLLPRTAPEVLQRAYFSPWQQQASEVWPHWLREIERFRRGLAAVFASHYTNFCPQVNLSSALAKIFSALPTPGYAVPREQRPVLLLCEEDFPSLGFVLAKAALEHYQLRFIQAGSDVGDLQLWSQHLREDVALVLITHVHSNTSQCAPVGEIVALARAAGAVSVVDIAQSAGVVPVDVDAWNADFVLGSCVKWLCGGPGAGFMWVNPARVETDEPTDVGWFSHADPFEFDIHHFSYAADALRYWGGTPSVAPYVVAANSISVIGEIGIPRIREHNLKLTRMLIDGLGHAQVLRTPRADAQRGGTVVLHFGRKQHAVSAALEAADVQFDARVEGIRLSPHIYNTEDEMAQVIDLCTGAV